MNLCNELIFPEEGCDIIVFRSCEKWLSSCYCDLIALHVYMECRQKRIMTRSAKFVHGLSRFLDGGQAVTPDLRKRRFARHAAS